jgi:hypothetical protein
MTRATLGGITVLLGLMACGRTELLRYSSASDAGADGGVVGCVPGVIGLEKATPRVVFVLDRSNSMSAPFGAGRATRWRSLGDALGAVLPPVDQTMELGALLFPLGSGGTCAVGAGPNLAPALGNVGSLVRLMSNTLPGGHTPTATAIAAAGDVVLADRAATAARALVLATDGVPNCNASLNATTCTCSTGAGRCTSSILCLDDDRSVAQVARLAALGVPTYVLGIQDSSTLAMEVLNDLARAGGRPRTGTPQAYYAVTSETDLDAALTAIRNQVGACVYLSSSVPDDDGSMEVTVGGTAVPFDATGTSGWSWSVRDNGELVLTGAACAAAIATPDAVLEARVLCRPADAGVDAGVLDGGRPDGG